MKEFKSKLAQYMIAAINEKRNNGYSYQEEERAIKDVSIKRLTSMELKEQTK